VAVAAAAVDGSVGEVETEDNGEDESGDNEDKGGGSVGDGVGEVESEVRVR
jgi:hypothetical protein